MGIASLFYPRSVAVVGASHELGSVGNEVLKNLVQQGFKGKIYPVNPKGGKLYGKHVYRLLGEIDAIIDLIVVAVPAKLVPQILHEAGFKKVKAAIVISAGFKEAGHPELEAEIAAICQKHRLTLVGPNCLGLINPEIKLNASFGPLMPTMGKVAFLSQSGAICASVLDYARERNLGFSKFISLGNKALVNEGQMLEYLYHDSQTQVIMMYVEQLQQIPEIMAVAKKVTTEHPHKPIIILKSGRTLAGSTASQSHTGALGGSEAGYDALFAQSGMIRAESIEELFDFAECFADNPPLKESQIAVITNAGGPGVLTTDALIGESLELAILQPSTQEKLRQFLPASASVKNPIDILGDADAQRYQQTMELVIKDPAVAGLLVILTPQSMTEVEKTARAIRMIRQQTKKPIVVSFMGDDLVAAGLNVLHHSQVATIPFPEPAARALGALNQFREWLLPKNQHGFRFSDVKSKLVTQTLALGTESAARMLSINQTFAILKAYGFPVVKRVFVESVEQAEAAKSSFHTDLVLKVVSPDIVHKTEAGGVILKVKSSDLAEKYHQLLNQVESAQPSATVEGVEIMEMVEHEGQEILLGVTTDPVLGKLIAVGWGGIYTEVIKDVSWGIAPLTHFDARRMVRDLKLHQIIKGVRGQVPLDEAILIELLGRLSQLVMNFPQIKELDINPLLLKARGQGAKVLDARIMLE